MEILQQAVTNYCKLPAKKPDPCATITDLYEQMAGSQVGASLLRAQDVQQQLQVTHWVRYSLLHLRQRPDLLASALAHTTYLVGDQLSLADLAVWAQLSCCPRWQAARQAGAAQPAIERHFKLISAEAGAAVGALKAPATQADGTSSGSGLKFEEGGKFRELAGAVHGEVVVRFPPEASGYLHVGHAKAALLNQHYRNSCGGRLIMRFDDTNPAKETAEFEQVILEDVAALGITYDHFSHTSDHFDHMLQLCERMLREGKAFVDDTDPDTMKAEREKRVVSRNRNNSVEQNIRLWEEMKAGTQLGCRCCVRAKIDMQSDNGCMRDPTIYRCKDEPHLRTGRKYKVYPTYDFACPIVDSLEGVTHALRTLEYKDRDAQYNWFIDALGLRRPLLEEFSRLALQNTVLSKRKLTWFVNEGLVDGWDDPRFPTVRGILRRGMTLEGLRQFILAQGFAKSNATMEWDKIWAFNKKVIDPVAPRYTALLKRDAVLVRVTNFDRAEPYSSEVVLHQKNPDVGTKTLWHWRELLIEGADAETLREGELVTFINWGNLSVSRLIRGADGRVTEVEAELRLDNTDYKKTQKVTWLSKQPDNLAQAVCVHYDHIISKPLVGKDEDFRQFVNRNSKRQELMLGDAGLASLRKGDIIQLQRRGFFICDSPAGQSPHSGANMPCYLIAVPDGHQKEMPKSGSRHKEVNHIVTSAAATSVKGSSGGSSSKASAARGAKASTPPNVAVANGGTSDAGGLNLLRQIEEQGNRVRDLKAAKADNNSVQVEVKKLLQLKADFKTLSGQDWKAELLKKAEASAPSAAGSKTPAPAAPARAAPEAAAPSASSGMQQFKPLLEKIAAQGDLVRDLKAKKADQAAVKSAVDQLLLLKTEFKKVSGQDWKAELLQKAKASAPAAAATAAPAAAAPSASSGLQQFKPLLEKIAAQGDLVRDLKAKKADQAALKSAVDQLLQLKAEFKKESGQDWKADLLTKAEASATAANATTSPHSAAPAAAAPSASSGMQQFKPLLEKIAAQGDLVRDLKAKKADQAAVKTAINQLLALKSEFKDKSGLEHKPELLKQLEQQQQAPAVSGLEQLRLIKEAGDKVRSMKDAGASKADLQSALGVLMQAKEQFKQATGQAYKPDMLKALE